MIPVNLLFTCLTLLLLPIYVVRFQVGPVPSTILEVLIILTVLSWLVENGRLGLRAIWEKFQSPILVAGAALVAVAFVEVWISPDHRSGLGEWRAYFLEPFLLGLVTLDLARRGWGKWLLLSLIGSGVWVGAVGIAQLGFHQFLNITSDTFREFTFGRGISVYNSGNSLALYLGPLVPLILIFTGTIYPWLVAAALEVGIAIWGSKSHGGWLALAGSLGVGSLGLILGKFNQRLTELFWRALPWIPVALAAVFFIFFVRIDSFAPPGHAGSGRIYTDTRELRLCLWQGTKNILTENPILGSGMAGFQSAYAKNFTCDNELLVYPHNILLNFWVETGLAGLLVILAIFWLILHELGRAKDRLLALALAAAFLYLIFHGLVDVPYFKNDLAAEFWVLVALAIAVAEDKFSLKS